MEIHNFGVNGVVLDKQFVGEGIKMEYFKKEKK